MKNQKQSIRKIVGFLNNTEEDGGFWLPNIQRQFVWDEEQICVLFDSILRQYPISTLLVWRTTSVIRRRQFIENWEARLPLIHEPEDSRRKYLVLDGQQRLQSLFIGLKGSFEGRELHFDCLSGDKTHPEATRYRFEFRHSSKTQFPWIRFKDLVYSQKRHRDLRADLQERAGRTLSVDEVDRIADNLETIDRTFKSEDAITYQELDSIDFPDLYREDDVVEIFIRANSGGTKLSKSELLFSLLTAGWEVADTQMEELLERLNRHGFAFDRDFVLKTCLVLLDQGAQYAVEKFRKPGVREELQRAWRGISDAILAIEDFLRTKTYIRGDQGLPSYLSLIPLIYIRYRFPGEWAKARGVEDFLVRCLLAGAFGGQSDRLLDALVARFRELGRFDADAAFAVIKDQQRSLQLPAERFLRMGYGSKTVHLIFNLWYPGFTYVPAFDDHLPQVDHIFPRSLLRRLCKPAGSEGEGQEPLAKDDINRLANCMLLTREENGAGAKRDTPPEQWFKDKPDEYLALHLIPRDPALWQANRYFDFIAKREQMILERFRAFVVAAD